MLIFGTRPEAIKMAPLVKEFRKYSDFFDTKVCVTAQHREMLDQVLHFFEIKPDYDLDLMKPEQNLYGLTATIILSLKPILEEFKPDYVDSYVAIVNIILQEQTKIIEEMDKIAMSNKRSDILKYDALKDDLNSVWSSCIPYCEAALEYAPNDLEVLKLLSQFYYKLDNIDGYKEINARIETLSN